MTFFIADYPQRYSQLFYLFLYQFQPESSLYLGECFFGKIGIVLMLIHCFPHSVCLARAIVTKLTQLYEANALTNAPKQYYYIVICIFFDEWG